MKKFYQQRAGSKIRSYLSFIRNQLRKGNHGGCWTYCSFDGYRDSCIKEWLVDGIVDHVRERLRSEMFEDLDAYTLDEVISTVQDAEFLSSLYYKQDAYVGQEAPVYNSEDFEVDNNGYVIVYTDGACPRNGQPGAKGGIGVCFGPNNDWNVREPLDESYRQTNNVAEIMAVVEAMKIVEQNGMDRVAIHTDSEFLINSMTSYIYQWLGNGWVRSNGKPVANKPEFRSLLFAMEDMDVEWIHVPAHQANGSSRHAYGNNEADRLARMGAKL